MHSLAARHGLSGYVWNTGTGVDVEIQGVPERVESFAAELPLKAPPLAVIESISMNDLPDAPGGTFEIRQSDASGEKFSLISPDIATCDDCVDELRNPADRRHNYPFINCTNCGPRFTIIRDVPYDRPKTTMDVFPMCAACGREYSDPGDRRFHAQPNTCEECGPSLTLVDVEGAVIARGAGALAAAARLLLQGSIVAVKGVGGYHLACIASDNDAVATLRARKYREDKPFAIMAAGVADARELCEVSESEARALLSLRRPIVLCARMPDARVAPAAAPGNKFLGIMLPYTPLHHLLLDAAGAPLVMTSGNRSDEPIAYKDADVKERVRGIADAYLMHNREIHMRCDDSVVRVWRGVEYPVRRARGYAPAPIKLRAATSLPILACGAELKSTFCLTRGDYAFLSHHIGDLDNIETLTSFEEGIDHYERLFHIKPEVIAYDLHPEYLSTKYALARNDVSEKIAVQHHHAHIVSCLVDNNEKGPVIGIAMDGLGYGTDGMMWGGEWLVGDAGGFVRAAHLWPVPMPGGTAAIKQPWRMAVSLLYCSAPDEPYEFANMLKSIVTPEDYKFVVDMIEKNINCPVTTSMGRVFDAFSALITGRREINYEGQAAIELEMMAADANDDVYDCGFYDNGERDISWGVPPDEVECCRTGYIIDFCYTLLRVALDLANGLSRPVIAAKFHSTIAAMIVETTTRIRTVSGFNTVALSGGVFQNMLLLKSIVTSLEKKNFRVLTHKRVPTNDGGLSLGQAAIAAELIIRR